MSRPKSLVECCMRTIMSNVDSIEGLGDLPYRLAKPILMVMSAEKLAQIEKNSPHLKEDDQEIWETLCIQQFSIRKDSADFEAPKSWRKYYHVSITRLKQLEEDAGARARSKYAQIAAQKQERGLVFKATTGPMKRGRTSGWGQLAPPKTLFDRARTDARKQAVIHKPSAKQVIPTVAPSTSFLFGAPTRPITVTTTTRSSSTTATTSTSSRSTSTSSSANSPPPTYAAATSMPVARTRPAPTASGATGLSGLPPMYSPPNHLHLQRRQGVPPLPVLSSTSPSRPLVSLPMPTSPSDMRHPISASTSLKRPREPSISVVTARHERGGIFIASRGTAGSPPSRRARLPSGAR